MALSHTLLPLLYRKYFSLMRGGALPISRVDQCRAEERILTDLIARAPALLYCQEYFIEKDTPYESLTTLPLATYEEVYPAIERTWNGEANVLFSGTTKWFAKSSGTTNARSKYIPVTDDSLTQNHHNAGRDMFGQYLTNNPESQIGWNGIVGISGSIQEENPQSGARAADVSTIIEKNSPWWVDMTKVIPPAINDIPKWEDRLPKLVEYLHGQDVRGLAGTVTWVQILIEKMIETYKVKNILEIWPNLEVFFHGAVSITPYLSVFHELIPRDNFHYVEVYNASEGIFAFQDTSDRERGMLLLTNHGIFYEFIDQKDGSVVRLADVVLHHRYEIVISTVGGLWRYRLGDVVEIVSLDPVRVKVAGRTKAVLNAYGEELMVGTVDEAFKRLEEKHGFRIREYTGAPVYRDHAHHGAHEWVIEFDKAPDDMESFQQLFDQELRILNSDYDAKRAGDLVLTLPIIHSVPRGTFYAWMAARGKLGAQSKVPRLSEKREYVEELREHAGKAK